MCGAIECIAWVCYFYLTPAACYVVPPTPIRTDSLTFSQPLFEQSVYSQIGRSHHRRTHPPHHLDPVPRQRDPRRFDRRIEAHLHRPRGHLHHRVDLHPLLLWPSPPWCPWRRCCLKESSFRPKRTLYKHPLFH
ncbi:hypothetical protein BC939DRAFT_445985 [Gamsiella multidivaricata]|uniref:uncharacterized protein n=1 Tax=Gamsiella multidivaricata TaxID=101098 RepID=UPI00221E9B1B|nr:uncharacterized protein BC939DRAFT_445985 [Gamsiella multidivaricata]KAI7827181.1 hypothetical protein BC939DRAFT_445985 [Gamsiella multidivaricata]